MLKCLGTLFRIPGVNSELTINLSALKTLLNLIIVLIIPFLLFGCSTSQYLSALSSVQADSLKQINDEEIRKAFEAIPQITIPTTIAIYNASQDKFPFQDSVITIELIDRAVEISPSLLNPGSYYQSQRNPYWNTYNTAPQPIDLKQLRLYAAQAKADLVLFISSSSSFKQDVNLLSPLYVGLVTIPFVPGQHVRLTTYLEAYLFDVRNGMLYSSYRDKRVLKRKFARISFQDKINIYKGEQVTDMMPDFLTYINETLSNPTLQLQLVSEK